MYDWSERVLQMEYQTWNVSVVVERMYDWSCNGLRYGCFIRVVSVVVERMYDWSVMSSGMWADERQFQLLLKGCTIEARTVPFKVMAVFSFSCCWKDVRLKLQHGRLFGRCWFVSVVVERMYDWSSETNWLKTNDFWQLVSDLFFENGRSAQKVPLFSKIWGDLGDCLTVFDSCSNI